MAYRELSAAEDARPRARKHLQEGRALRHVKPWTEAALPSPSESIRARSGHRPGHGPVAEKSSFPRRERAHELFPKQDIEEETAAASSQRKARGEDSDSSGDVRTDHGLADFFSCLISEHIMKKRGATVSHPGVGLRGWFIIATRFWRREAPEITFPFVTRGSSGPKLRCEHQRR